MAAQAPWRYALPYTALHSATIRRDRLKPGGLQAVDWGRRPNRAQGPRDVQGRDDLPVLFPPRFETVSPSLAERSAQRFRGKRRPLSALPPNLALPSPGQAFSAFAAGGGIRNESGLDYCRTAPRGSERGGLGSVAEPIRQYLPQATLALAILVLIAVFAQPRQQMPPRTPAAEPARPAPAPPQFEQCGRRHRPLPGDAAGKGAAGRFPDGRYQRL